MQTEERRNEQMLIQQQEMQRKQFQQQQQHLKQQEELRRQQEQLKTREMEPSESTIHGKEVSSFYGYSYNLCRFKFLMFVVN